MCGQKIETGEVCVMKSIGESSFPPADKKKNGVFISLAFLFAVCIGVLSFVGV